MQTLRKRTSPCKYKNDPSRFLGEGITFKAKLIGILEVSEARGDKMCQDALNDLKTAIRAAGEHKQRITISISIDGLRLRDEKTGDCLYHHPVHKISFIAQDMSDSRAFGYIFGSPDTGHRFFGIKTDKTASQVVISMRDLFQVVFELKKKEIEMAKHHSEAHHFKYGSTGYMDSIHFPKDESELDKGKGKYPHVVKSRCLSSKSGDSGPSDHKGPPSEAIADLLDLEHELNTIQQGINQMDKITPSDPFGPLSSKSDSYADPFDDSFPAKPPEEKPPGDKDLSDRDNHFYKPSFLSQFSPGKSRAEDGKWIDQDTDSLFRESGSTGGAEATSSPVAFATPALEPEQAEGKKSPIKTDLFTELDPLGTGRVKPYVDKKDFFQELKNPPRKVLKEMISGGPPSSAEADLPPFYFPRHPKDKKNSHKSDSSALESMQSFQEGKPTKTDPFEDGDPFEETDPFQEVIFPSFGARSSMDGIFDDKLYWTFDKSMSKEEKPAKASSSGAALRVSLPPEKTEVPISISTITSKLKSSSPPSPEDSKAVRRKCYQSLKQSTVEGSEESPVREELFISVKIGSKSEWERGSPFKNKFYSPLYPRDPQVHSSAEILDATTPDPPPRAKTALFSIKPPPLPPKKQNPKPPARPPSFEDKFSHYDYLEKKEISDGSQDVKCVKLKKPVLSDSAPSSELKKQNSGSGFPVLPPPPQRRTSTDGTKVLPRKTKQEETPSGSVLNLKLNQLDNTGLENLAISLGIPSENIYSMTLQELTKMLAEKYLKETKSEEPKSFEADFDANFGKAEKKPAPPSYDKYAVFKELIENETKEPEVQQEAREKKEESEGVGQEEDKYAALRQLSLSAQAENFSEDDETVEAEAIEAKASTPKLPQDSPKGPGGSEPKWPPSDSKTEEKKSGVAEGADAPGPRDPNPSFSSDSQLFPLVDQFSEEKKPSSPRDNWATFEKSDYEKAVKKSGENFNENENSPLSSDGKEEMREIPFEWHGNTFGKRERKDVPWRDDDESWDDYSPKESYCSDESSHEERSPEGGGNDSYEKTWSVCGRPPKSWNRRDKWQEETEDEFEESWKKQREKSGAYESERKNFWHNNYEGYNKRYDWYGNTRSEPWDENDRHHCYGNRRKRSESDNEYRKRCDSDASEKEFVWTFQKDSPDIHGRPGKQKQYHGPGHCPDHYHEPRSKHRKAVTQKRPTSASEPKRNYEKFSPGDYTFRSSDKSYPISKREPDNSRFIYKESRHRGDGDFSHYCSSYDRKASRAGSRGSRTSGPDAFPKRGDAPESKNHKFGYFEPFSEKNYKYGKGSGSQIQFPGDAGKTKKGAGGGEEEFPERRAANQWASTNGKSEAFYSARNNNEDFGGFREEFKNPSKSFKGNGKAESCEGGKRGKSHLGMLGRQEGGSALRKSDSVNIFSRDKDPFEGDDFFSSVS